MPPIYDRKNFQMNASSEDVTTAQLIRRDFEAEMARDGVIFAAVPTVTSALAPPKPESDFSSR